MVAPAFWVVYRGNNDPQIPLATTYVYTANFYLATGVQLYSATFTILGPTQLTKRDYMDVRWTPMIGLTRVSIALNSAQYYDSEGSSQGFRDEGQYSKTSGGVLNQ